MSIERNLLISLLKLTKDGAVKQELVYSDAHIPSTECNYLLKKLQNSDLLDIKDGLIESNTQSRLTLAIEAIKKGAPIEQISNSLKWQEFEAMAALALQLNGYITANNIHFTHNSKRWEIDVIGSRKPLVLCIDCKHWHKGMHPSGLKKIAQAQTKRTLAFQQSMLNGKFTGEYTHWNKAILIPIIISLIMPSQKFSEQIPIVPVLQLQDFISQLPLNLDKVARFPTEIKHL